MTTKKRTKRSGQPSKAMALLNEIVDEPMTFASTLRMIRETDELSQAEVARRVGVTRAHICDIEKGRKLVSPERAARFAKVLGYGPEQFVRLALQDQVQAAGLKLRVKVEAA